MGKRIAVLVSNDLNHDQRVLKTCDSLVRNGWTPVLFGRELSESSELTVPFEAYRVRLPFHRGAGFYAALQVAFLRQLLKHRCDAIWANDLDTLLPAYAVSRWRRLPLVYDSHEYFTEAAGLTGRPFQRGVWLAIEQRLFPRVKSVITVNESIAEAYQNRYPNAACIKPLVVRNMPRKVQRLQNMDARNWRVELGIPSSALFLILQGAFLDQDRGVVQAVEALRTQSDWYLVVVGAGAEWDWAKQQVEGLGGRLICLPKMPFDTLRSLTAAADAGLSLDRGIHGNYWMSLPNKLFDYIHAGIPVVASPMPEVARIVREHEVGVIAEELDAEGISKAVQKLLQRDFTDWRVRCLDASETLNWEAEEHQIGLALSKACAD